ncbi:MAG: adenine phosphoribosyltransferase [Trueperaceae bacterium]|jgi:adenine phosphoribosyltransferase|nr:adenine phosphoribosyltransferase [Trueperaceae bacterium]MCH2667005.1 adenine phosphoribosyltransferase [Deinococcales bacterium]|tara:strand:- start:361 stop:903 length:543 start_codon:yes stop_codon:yes gene_type:complete
MNTHRIQIGEEIRDLQVINLGDVSLALLNLLGDARLTEAAATELVPLIPSQVEVLVTPEVKAVPLAHAMSVRTDLPYVVARKTEKAYMVDPHSRPVSSITTRTPQLLVIDGADVPKIEGKVVAIVDDVVSTGGTLESLVNLITDLGGEVVTTLVVFTEGVRRNDVISLGHLPLYDKVDGV